MCVSRFVVCPQRYIARPERASAIKPAARLDGTAYGVCCNSDDAGNFEYVCGVEVRDYSGIPKDWARVRIPAQLYAVFVHREHVAKIRSTWHTIWNQWLPQSGCQVSDAPLFERYGEEFNSQTGMGGAEIWLPVSKGE